MSKEKPDRAKFDKATSDWFRKHPFSQTTVARCETCGLYYKPELSHKCKVKGEKK